LTFDWNLKALKLSSEPPGLTPESRLNKELAFVFNNCDFDAVNTGEGEALVAK